MKGVIYINNLREIERCVEEPILKTKIRNKIDNSEGLFPGSDTIKKILSNPRYVTSSSVKYLYNCLKFYEMRGVTGGRQYNEVYDAIVYYERRLLK